MSGRILLRGSQLREARSVLSDLSRFFLALPSSPPALPTLAGGDAGYSLIHSGLDAAFPRRGHATFAQQALGRAVEALATTALPPSLHAGFTGVAWVAELLFGDPSAPPDDDGSAAIDVALDAYLSRTPWKDPFDLIDGLVGIGVYALERLPRPPAKRLVDLVLARLSDTAHRMRPGIAWPSSPEWVAALRQKKPNGRKLDPDWNLGIAHGMPGVIAFLGRVTVSEALPSTRKIARTFLRGAVAWLLAQQLPDNAEGCFAATVTRGLPVTGDVPGKPARLGWCHGDLGVAAALLLAGRAVGKSAWMSAATRIALRAAARAEESSGVIDAGLCHGAAGVAHIFHRLFRATDDERFAKAARFWFGRTLAMRGARGFAGFPAWGVDANDTLSWVDDPCLLTGTGGVTLALLAAATDHEFAWDRALLVS